MANSVTIQLLEDGPRNVVVKFEGVLDTADVAQTGQIGASGFTTTTGSNTITFVAGALAPTIGQYVTFSDGTATFPTGTYITSIVDATHITVNNVALKNNAAAAVTITGTAGAIVVVDPALLSQIDSFGNPPSQLRIDCVQYNVEDALSVNLFWEATSSIRIEEFAGRGVQKNYMFGGLTNNSGAGKTGRITATTQGWAGTLSFSLIIKMVKQ